jgi:hypothetical protein
VYDKLPRKTKEALALAPGTRKKLISEKRKLLADRKTKK